MPQKWWLVIRKFGEVFILSTITVHKISTQHTVVIASERLMIGCVYPKKFAMDTCYTCSKSPPPIPTPSPPMKGNSWKICWMHKIVHCQLEQVYHWKAECINCYSYFLGLLPCVNSTICEPCKKSIHSWKYGTCTLHFLQ